jgi:hypothetical protein
MLAIVSTTTLHGAGSNEDDDTFTAAGLVLEPGIHWTKVHHRFSFTSHAGYELNINGKTWHGENSYLINDDGDPVMLDWSGFRLGIGVAFSL